MNSRCTRILISAAMAAALVLPSLVLAEDTKEAKKPDMADMANMKPPTPGPENMFLTSKAGKWKTTMTMHMGDNAMTMDGTSETAAINGGMGIMFLVKSPGMKMMPMPFE